MVLLLPIFEISTNWVWFSKSYLNHDFSTPLTPQISNLTNKIWWFRTSWAFDRSRNITTAFRWLSSTSNILYIKAWEMVSVDLPPLNPFCAPVRILYFYTKELSLLNVKFPQHFEKKKKYSYGSIVFHILFITLFNHGFISPSFRIPAK